MTIQVVASTSFLGSTGYNAHSQGFFTSLNNFLPVRIRNYTYTPKLSEFEKKHLSLLIEQEWQDPPYKIGKPFNPNPNDLIVNLVLNESNHYYFYDRYESPMIAFNVWESTRQMPKFFNRLLDYDQFWCPTSWQRICTIEQGYPSDRVKVVPEGVNGKLFHPPKAADIGRRALYKRFGIPTDTFTFMIFGRWDHRKSITEIIQAFNEEFKDTDKVMLVISVDNPFSVDGMKTTEERLKYHKLESEKIKILHFPPRYEYVNWMTLGNVFLSCSRSEGWNLPLIEAIASGTPAICSGWGAQLEFADGVAHLVDVPKFKSPSHVFNMNDGEDLGVWGEPDFDHLKAVMRSVYNNYSTNKIQAVKLSKYIRDIYTWENSAKLGAKYINELVSSSITVDVPMDTKGEVSPENEIKLNLGCGNDIQTDYINIDRYNNTGKVDINADFKDLPFGDETVDEIMTSHVFEHIKIQQMYDVLTEWRRVLKLGGRLVLYLPDLEAEVRTWLDTPDDKKWLEVHRIFGSQSHPGNTHYCGFNMGSLKSFLETFNFRVEDINIGDRGLGHEIQCKAIKLQEKQVQKANYICHFVGGPFIEIKGDSSDKGYYQIDFLDPDNEAAVHQTTLPINHWTRPFRKYFTNWFVQVRRNDDLTFAHAFDLKDKNVLINFDTRGMGDTIAWIPYIEDFRKKNKCNVIVSTFWNNLFRGHEDYKNIKFLEPGGRADNLYASYNIGCFDNDTNKNPINWRLVPLQKICTDILGLDYKEKIPSIAIKPGERDVKEKYVTLSEFSKFHQCKRWNYLGGWQTIVNWFNNNGYRVVVISKEETNLKNVINRTNRPIENTITSICHSEMFLGVSAGPSWLAWALRKPVILISGYSQDWAEFQSGVERVIDKEVCHGCFNNLNDIFERNNYNWCPVHQGTTRQFECTKAIKPQRVIKSINKIEEALK